MNIQFMKDDHESNTAAYMALFRAVESARPEEHRLFSDPLAASLLPTSLRFVAKIANLPMIGRIVPAVLDVGWPRTRSSGVVRTRLIDAMVKEAIIDGAGQLVLLGAGFDSRAYRLQQARRVTVFEVDHPDIFSARNVVLDGVNPRVQRREVSADLAGEWEPALVDAGFDPARPTMWLAEGLFFYLTEDAVRRLLATTARLCLAPARFGADLFGTGLLRLPGMQPLIDQRRGSGQPLPFCTDQPGELLAACGWRTDTLVHPGQARANFGRLPDLPPDWDGGPDPTMSTYLAVAVSHA